MVYVSDWRECFTNVKRILTSPGPVFLARVGGSDTNAVAALLEAQASGIPDVWGAIYKHRGIVERFNGFYDLDHKGINFWHYLELLVEHYGRFEHMFFCNHQLLSMYFKENVHPKNYVEEVAGRRGFELLVERLGAEYKDIFCYPFSFVEKLVLHPFSLMFVFQEALANKKVLVVSPFSESITANFHNRADFFKDYQYPDMDLRLYNTPITYSGLPENFYPHRNWFETAEAMKRDISNIDFDIALLACGSYAVPLGAFIANTMQRKAVYVGGILQMMFGVMGRRYDNPFWLGQINLEKFIYPIEGKKYLQHVAISSEVAREAFGAYF